MRRGELSSRARWVSRAMPLGAALAATLAAACSTLPEREPFEVDCSPEEDVELSNPRFDFEPTLDPQPPHELRWDDTWFSFGDLTPGAIPPGVAPPEIVPQPIPDGGRCGSAHALVIESYGHNDWGAGFGTYGLSQGALNGTGWEGIAFWARTADRSDRSVTLLITDRYSAPEGSVDHPETGLPTATCRPEPEKKETNCVNGVTDDGDALIDCEDPDCCGEGTVCGCPAACASAPLCSGVVPETHMTVCPRDASGEVYCVSVPKIPEWGETAATQSNEGQVSLGGELADRYDCGNAFQRVLTTTRHWQLYLLPFETFHQEAQPNRSPAGMDTSAIHLFMLRTPREAQMELWLDDIGLYRHVQ